MKVSQLSKLTCLLIAGIMGAALFAQAAVIMQDFGTLTKDGDMSLSGIADGNWHARTTDSWGKPSDAAMTATTLTQSSNPANANWRPSECPVARIVANSASGSTISFSFDYDVTGDSSPTLGFYLSGIDVTGASPYWSGSVTARGSNAWQTDGGIDDAHNTKTYSLFDGAVTGQAAAESYNGGLALTGSGTVSATIDLSGHAAYQNLSDYEYIAATFAWNFAADNTTVEISNFSVAIPEPATTGMMVSVAAMLLCIRRRLA